jgi:uncharacterized protein YkwD
MAKARLAALFMATGSVLFCADAPAQAPPQDLAAEMVADHNAVRASLALPPVVWDEALASQAQLWAEALVAGPGLSHSARASRPGEGENLARIDGGRTSATDLFTGWATEGARYRYGPLDCADWRSFATTGHYTQIIWTESRRIGCALAYARDSEVLVCRYTPPGNICGQAPY